MTVAELVDELLKINKPELTVYYPGGTREDPFEVLEVREETRTTMFERYSYHGVHLK